MLAKQVAISRRFSLCDVLQRVQTLNGIRRFRVRAPLDAALMVGDALLARHLDSPIRRDEHGGPVAAPRS
ncbi:MAG TPA: hypothetical protein VFR86_25475 [Burkholderiaceae bacterium]|nr:hypothetical protein [Burkholderiaceae bacterium]